MRGANAIENFLTSSGGGSSSGPSGRYLSYFILGEGDTKIVRFLTDVPEVELADFYEFVLDKNGKFQNFVVAPSYYADDPTWQGEDWVQKFGGKSRVYGSNELEDPKPKRRVVGIAVEREEVSVETGAGGGRRRTETQDKLIRIEGRDNVMHDARNFFVMKPTAKALWSMLIGYYNEFGTLCDRDYKITRIGTGREITYRVIPLTPDPDWDMDGSSLKELQARYGYGTGLDVDGNPITQDSEDRYLYITQTLSEWMQNQASEERARSALVGDGETFKADTTPPPSWATSSGDEPNAAPAANGTEVSSLRERLERHR